MQRSFNSLRIDPYIQGRQASPQISPLTKQVNSLQYELPKRNKYSSPWFYPPEFLKVFSDLRIAHGGTALFDCVLLGSPRPKVFWTFNEVKIHSNAADMEIVDTADRCQLIVKNVQPHHWGYYSVFAENEVGRATASAKLMPQI